MTSYFFLENVFVLYGFGFRILRLGLRS